jgi:hypothetical protein
VKKPAISRLLVKSLSAHYPVGQPPLSGRDSPAFKALQNWIQVLIANNPHLVESFDNQATTAAAARPVPVSPVSPIQPFVSAPPSALPEEVRIASKLEVPIELAAPGTRKDNHGPRLDVPFELPPTGVSRPKVEETPVKTPVANAPGSPPKQTMAGPAAPPEAAKKPPPAFDVPIELALPDMAKLREEKTFASYSPAPATPAAPATTPSPIVQTKATAAESFGSIRPANLPPQGQPANPLADRLPEPTQVGTGDPFDPAEFNRTMHPRR